MATKMTREEALNKVRQMSLPKETMEILEALAPELAESKDERIRKWLVNYFSTIKEMIWIHRDITCEQILDWLEKQKECVSNNFDDVWDEEDCEEIIAEGQKLTPRFKELLKEVCHAWYDRGAKLERQKEQKPAEKHDLVTQLKEHFANTPKEQLEAEWKELEHWNNIGPTVEEYFHRIKPVEWSEEDEKQGSQKSLRTTKETDVI